MTNLRKLLTPLFALSLLAASTNIALAQDDDPDSGEWEFVLSPLFLWGVNLNGNATMGDVTAPLELDFKDDILENLDAVFTVHFEARNDKWTFFGEYQHLSLNPGGTAAIGPVSADADIKFTNDMLELGVTYAFSETERTRWEVLAGARYTEQDISVAVTLDFPHPINERNINIDGGDSWMHGFAGLRLLQKLGEKWTFVGRADYGYGGPNNTAFNASMLFDYRFRRWGSAFVGWRYLKYDFDNNFTTDRYAFDAYQQGPLLGLSFHF